MNYLYTPKNLAEGLNPENDDTGYVYITGDQHGDPDIDSSIGQKGDLTQVSQSFDFDQGMFSTDSKKVLEEASVRLLVKVPREQLSQEALKEIDESAIKDE